MNQSYFPRGGAKESPVIQHRKFVFEKKKPPKSKKKNVLGKDSKISHLPNFIKLPAYKLKTSHFHQNHTDLRPGFQCVCAVNSINKNGLFVNLPFGSCAVISKSEISGPYSKLMGNNESQKNLLSMFFSGQLLSCKITECDTKDVKMVKLFATLKPSVINTGINSGLIRKHSMVQMAIASVEDHGYFMESGITGVTAFLPFKEASKYTKKILKGKKPLSIGTVVWTYVLKSSVNSSGANVVEVTIDPDKTCEFNCIEPSSVLWPGARVRCTIAKIYDDGCCLLLVDGTNVQGTVEARLNYSRVSCDADLTVGSSCQATVVSKNPLTNVYSFSFSHNVGETSITPVTSEDDTRNVICNGIVDKMNRKAAYLTLPGMKFKGCLSIGSLTGGKEHGGPPENDSEGKDVKPPVTSTFQCEPGDRITLMIRRLDLFSRMYICHISSKNNKERENNKKAEVRGQNNSGKLLSKLEIKEELESDSDDDDDDDYDIEIKEEPVSDSDDDIDIKEEDSGTDSDDEESVGEIKEEYDSDMSIKEEPISDIDEDEDDNPTDISDRKTVEDICSESEDSELDIKPVKQTKKRKCLPDLSEIPDQKKVKTFYDFETNIGIKKPVMNEFIKKKLDTANQLSLKDVDSSFLWDATPDDLARITTKDVEEFNEESDEEKLPKKPLSKKQKKVNELEKERKIREKEEELLKALEEPKSADHFERLILSKPDDSRIWVRYMAFYLEATEIEKARTVGKRALKLISHRNEQDRLNIWLALLNLEHLYGSKDLFKETWLEALQGNDDYQVNCKVLDMYASGSNALEVNSLVQKMTKQYRENSNCWYTCLSALMTAGLEDKARDLLQRALKALPPKAHVTLISRFALLENSFGHSEEGQALFDNLLSSYPARIDIWFVYLDMLIKSLQLDLVRQVFERATNQKLPAKKMKSIYKKWLEFEEKNGDEESVESVRNSAKEYVEKASKDIGV